MVLKLPHLLQLCYPQVVKQCYCECPSYDVMIPALLAHPISELPQHCRFMAGVPIKPMLAKATNAVR